MSEVSIFFICLAVVVCVVCICTVLKDIFGK